MNETIWKFEIPVPIAGYTARVRMPAESLLLSVGSQPDPMGSGHVMVVWAVVQSDQTVEDRVFAVYPTGAKIRDSLDWLRFIGTVQMPDGLVFHVFEWTGSSDA